VDARSQLKQALDAMGMQDGDAAWYKDNSRNIDRALEAARELADYDVQQFADELRSRIAGGELRFVLSLPSFGHVEFEDGDELKVDVGEQDSIRVEGFTVRVTVER